MDERQTISAVAASTGFSASALRFYEDAGLLTPDRTDAGYRLYDDRTVERIRFIARAKQLGLTLDEITELVALWEGDHCAPVAGRLGGLVEDKIRETHHRIAELVKFAADLQRARAGLAAAGNGPCGDACACHAEGTAPPVGVSLVAKPSAAAVDPPIACTLASDQATQRVGEWHALLARATGRAETDGGVVIEFPPEPGLAADVAVLAAAEQSCCSFFHLTLRMDHTGTRLTVTAPADARVLVDALFGASA
jgi:DNA-binding transcriptional MerR regulator